LLLLVTGCARGKFFTDENGNSCAEFRGWGSFKDGEKEINCKPPITLPDIEYKK